MTLVLIERLSNVLCFWTVTVCYVITRRDEIASFIACFSYSFVSPLRRNTMTLSRNFTISFASSPHLIPRVLASSATLKRRNFRAAVVYASALTEGKLQAIRYGARGERKDRKQREEQITKYIEVSAREEWS